MNIAILTWLHNGNYGSILQAYALQQYLRNKGLNVQNIDLHPSIIEKFKNMIQQRNPLFIFKDKWIALEARKSCKDKKALLEKTDKFNSFLNSNFNLTRKYRKFDELKELSGEYDAYICGSDQVWSPMLLSPSYYFDFLKDSEKKIAYACSFGMSSIPVSKRMKIANWLQSFDAISVREDTGIKIVKDLIGRDVVLNVDPTMLLDSIEWSFILPSRPLVEVDYMFCYFLTYNADYWKKSVAIAREKRLKLVLIPTTKETYNIEGAEIIENAGPEDWVNLIKHASLISTDSFHGCVFSIIFQKQFIVFKRFADSNILSQNSRIYTLLSTYGLRKCLIEDTLDLSIPIISDKEYSQAILRVKEKADNSKNWIISVING